MVLEARSSTARPEPHLGRLHPLTVGRWLRDAAVALEAPPRKEKQVRAPVMLEATGL